MIDPKALLGNVNSNGLVGKMLSGMATKNFAAGLLAGGVGGAMMRKGGKDMIEDAAKLGGLALLGTLAYKAYNNYQQDKAAGRDPNVMGSVKQSASDLIAQAKQLAGGIAAPAASAQLAASQHSPELTLAIMRAMIAAAKADGKMDDAEMQKILSHTEQGGLSQDEKMLLMREMASTADTATIASGAKTPEEAAEVYLAALLVCDSQCAAEQQFLSALAGALKLDSGFTSALQQQLLAMGAQQAA
ncbi:MAG: DUF533 domain-containing protein [Alphaproteobacteria bacterium]|nr:DUF533 domain-containing protein [Alphaproteobacteria bacterium]